MSPSSSDMASYKQKNCLQQNFMAGTCRQMLPKLEIPNNCLTPFLHTAEVLNNRVLSYHITNTTHHKNISIILYSKHLFLNTNICKYVCLIKAFCSIKSKYTYMQQAISNESCQERDIISFVQSIHLYNLLLCTNIYCPKKKSQYKIYLGRLIILAVSARW